MEPVNPSQCGMTDTDGLWKRSSKCSPKGDNCVEVHHAAHHVAVRDSAMTPAVGSPVLVFGSPGWQQFRTAVDIGAYDGRTHP